MEQDITERWVSGELYESYVGRWSRLVAQAFLSRLDAPAGLAWLDVGCGTGACSKQLPKAARLSVLPG